jgi:hypothetical protein
MHSRDAQTSQHSSDKRKLHFVALNRIVNTFQSSSIVSELNHHRRLNHTKCSPPRPFFLSYRIPQKPSNYQSQVLSPNRLWSGTQSEQVIYLITRKSVINHPSERFQLQWQRENPSSDHLHFSSGLETTSFNWQWPAGAVKLKSS